MKLRELGSDAHDDGNGRQWPRRLAFLLLPEFNLLSMTGAVEPFRVANHLLDEEWFEWVLVTPGEARVAASNGIEVHADGDLDAAVGADLTIVCASWFPEHHAPPRVLQWLREQASAGMRLGGVDTGSFVLAAAGVLDHQLATCNYDVLDAFRDRFPRVVVSNAMYVADARHVTCSGSTAALDLAVTLVGRARGEQLADRVASHMFHQRFGGSAQSQLSVVNNTIDHENPRLAAAIVAVRDNLAHPLTAAELAAHSGTSARQLRRLFAQAFGVTPSAYAMQIRLDRARQLVLHTELRMLDVALATGFEGPEHFSRRYKAAFGSAPLRDRKQHRPRLTATTFPARIGNR